MKQLRYIYLCVLICLWAIQATHAMPAGSLAMAGKSIWFTAQHFADAADAGEHITPSRLSQFHKHSRHSQPNTYRVGGLLPGFIPSVAVYHCVTKVQVHPAYNAVCSFSTALLLIYPHHYFW